MPTDDGRLTAAELAQIYALVQAQAAIRQQLTRLAVAGVLVPLRMIRSWWDTLEVTWAALEALRVLQPIQTRMAQVTDVYLARVLSVATGRAVRPIGAIDVRQLRRELTDELAPLLDRRPQLIRPSGDLDLSRVFEEPEDDDDEYGWPDDEPDFDLDFDDRDEDDEAEEEPPRIRPADMVDVYSRIAAEYRYHVTQGMDEVLAEQEALERAETMAATDVMLAMRGQAREVMRRHLTITGYRRVLHPELSKDGTSCGLCIVAADRIYRKEFLLPIHANCHCEVVPIVGGVDPGLQLNRDDLERLYGAAGGSTYGRQLKYVRAVITEHGELGPILAEAPKNPRGPRRGPREVARTTTRQYRTLSPEERLPGLLRLAEEAGRRLAAGETRMARTLEHYQRIIDELMYASPAGR